MANFKVPYEFVAGTKAKAEEVNINFSAIKEELNKKLDVSNDGYITIKDAITDNQPISKFQFDTVKKEINTSINEKIENKELKNGFLITDGNLDSNGNPDLLDIDDDTKVVFKVDDGTNYKPLKCVLANNQCFERTTIPDLSVSALADGTYNLYIAKEGSCIALANTIFQQKFPPKKMVETNWIQPVLTENGTLGGNTFAVYCDDTIYTNSNPAYFAFDNNSSTSAVFGVYNYKSLTIYNPIPIKLKSFTWTQPNIGGGYCRLYASNDNLNWTLIHEEVSSPTEGTYTWDFINNEISYKYFRFDGKSTSGGAFGVSQFNITGTQTLGHILTNSIWLDTSVKPYISKKHNGTNWENFDYLPLPQNITVKNGIITSINKCGNYNDNGWDNYVTLPDFSRSTNLTKGITYNSPQNGWLFNNYNLVKPMFIGDTFTPMSNNYIFYAMKGE